MLSINLNPYGNYGFIQTNAIAALQHMISSGDGDEMSLRRVVDIQPESVHEKDVNKSNDNDHLSKLLEYDPFANFPLQEVSDRSLAGRRTIELNRHRVLSIPESTDTFVRCCIIRDTKGTRSMCPRYIFSFQSDIKVIAMAALKQAGNRRSNYHIFDISNGSENMKLIKKSGNYIGKLRKDEISAHQSLRSYSLFNWSTEKEQVAAFMFDTMSFMEHLSRVPPPRSFVVLLPKIDESGKSVPIKIQSEKKLSFSIIGGSSKVQPSQHYEDEKIDEIDMTILRSRSPCKETGYYRLNFNGRVKSPSVKNMQLENENKELFMQFGRVEKNIFHLDYRYEKRELIVILCKPKLIYICIYIYMYLFVFLLYKSSLECIPSVCPSTRTI